MSILSDWVTQIIIFIFIGTILELIIPNNSMKRYVHIVVGLILLLILVKPILFIFQAHIPSSIDKIEEALFTQDDALLTTEKQIEEQKSDIESGQDAYIWNEVTAQLIHEANPILEESYPGIIITDLAFETINEEKLTLENMKSIVVTLALGDSDEAEISIVQPVEIGKREGEKEAIETKKGNEIRQKLAQLWGIEEEKIEYIWEEG